MRNWVKGLTAALAVWLLMCCPALAEESEGWEGVLSGVSFSEIAEDGFHVPVPAGEGWTGGETRGLRGLFAEAVCQDEKENLLTYQVYCQDLDQFALDEQTTDWYYDAIDLSHLRNVVTEQVIIDGQKARLIAFSYDNSDGSFQANGGILLYAREMRLLQIRIYAERENRRERKTPKITLEDLKHLAEHITFVPEEAPIRYSDVELTIIAENNRTVISAGGKLQLKAQYGNEDLAARFSTDDEIIWTLTDTDTGEESTIARISGKGLVSAEKNVTWIQNIRVTAVSSEWQTSATYILTVLPAARSIQVSPTSIVFFSGENRTETLSVTMEPDYIPLKGFTWSVNKKNLVEIVDQEDGTAIIKPLENPGKGVVTVKEPSGRTASVSVTVLRPVEALTLSRRGQATAGSSVIFSVKLTPYNPGDRTVVWSVDVGEEIATITQRGKLTIRKDVPEGTVIHVTCMSNCAPTPISVTEEVVVAGK